MTIHSMNPSFRECVLWSTNVVRDAFYLGWKSIVVVDVVVAGLDWCWCCYFCCYYCCCSEDNYVCEFVIVAVVNSIAVNVFSKVVAAVAVYVDYDAVAVALLDQYLPTQLLISLMQLLLCLLHSSWQYRDCCYHLDCNCAVLPWHCCCCCDACQ